MMQFLTELQRQLVAASRELTDRADELLEKSDRPRRRPSAKRIGMILCGGLLVSSTALAATSNLPGQTDDRRAALERVPAIARAGLSYPSVRAHGLDPDRAGRVLTTDNGLAISKVANAKETCLLIGPRESQCFSAINIATGRGFSIFNDCSPGGTGAMRIVGVAPPGTTTVQIVYSDGPGAETNPKTGVFVVNSMTPAEGQSYPVAIRYVGTQHPPLEPVAIPGAADPCMRRELPAGRR
jgi:hypothetical protein